MDWNEFNPFEADDEHRNLSESEVRTLVMDYIAYRNSLPEVHPPLKRMSFPMVELANKENLY